MALGKLDERSDDNIVSEINITPLTDIFLVLLIIFMITSSALIESGANIDLPEVSETASVSKNNVIVTLTEDNEIYINEQQVSEEQFEVKLAKILEKTSEKLVILEGDKQAILGDAVRILEKAKLAGAEEVAIAAVREEVR